MCETEPLIIAVEKHPCLWDIYNEDYHKRDLKDLAWAKVCKEVANDWETCDKLNKCADLKRKWTHIRDYYRKSTQKQKSSTGSAAKKQRKYVFADMLYFLDPIFDKQEGKYPNNTKPLLEPVKLEDPHNIIEEDNIRQPPLPSSHNKKKQQKEIDDPDDPSQLINVMQQGENITQHPNYEEDDDDTNFLLSFRSHMKRMNMNQKIDFKLGMLQLVKRIITGPCPSSSRMNSENYNSDNSFLSVASPDYSQNTEEDDSILP